MLALVGKYKILDRIGPDPLGETYRARDTQQGRTAAVTILAAAIADDPARRAAFFQEARRVVTLSHPNIAAIYEVSDDPQLPFVACEFVTGDSLKTRAAGRPL